MSTHAAVFVRNADGTFTGTEITSDGYIELVRPNRLNRPDGYGAGWLLAQYWQDSEEIEKLARGNMVHSLGEDLNNTDFYDSRQTGLDNLTFDEVKNLSYSYIYIFHKDSLDHPWSVINPNSSRYNDTLFALDCFLDYDDPERFFDHEEFWN
jgi:hypothetical protein